MNRSLYIFTAISKGYITLVQEQSVIHSYVLENGKYIEQFAQIQNEDTKVDAVYVCSGPGRFVSLRFGVSVAYGLQVANETSVFSFSLFDLYSAVQSVLEISLPIVFQANMDDYFINGEKVSESEVLMLSGEYMGEIKSVSKFPLLSHVSFEEEWMQDSRILLKLQELSLSGVTVDYGTSPRIGAN